MKQNVIPNVVASNSSPYMYMYMSYLIPAEFGSGVYAILKGKVVEFMMTLESVTLGRNSTQDWWTLTSH